MDQGDRFYASSDGDGEHAPGSVQAEGDTACFTDMHVRIFDFGSSQVALGRAGLPQAVCEWRTDQLLIC